MPSIALLRQSAPILGVAAGILAIYYPVLKELIGDWLRDPNYSHGFFIPLVSGWLIYKRRAEFNALPVSPSNVGFLGILLAAAMLVLGTAGAEVFTQRMSLLLLLGSLVLFLFGWRHLRVTAFPIAFLFFAIPLPYVIYYGLTAPLQTLAAKVAVVGLKGSGIPAMIQGNTIHLSGMSLEVAEACSGIRSLYAFLAAGAIMARFTPVAWPFQVLIFLLTIPLSVAGNALRVWGSGVAAHLAGLDATTGTPHEIFGTLVFVTSFALFLLIRKAVKTLCSSDPSSPS